MEFIDINLKNKLAMETTLDKVDSLEKRMLEDFEGENLVSLSFVQMDNDVQMTPNYSGKITLQEYVAMNQFVTEENLFIILEQFLQTQNQVKNYFLNESHFVLNEKTILVDQDFREIEFLYLPLKDEEFSESDALVKDFVQQLSTFLNAEEEFSDQLEELMRSIQSPYFSIDRLQELLYQITRELPRNYKQSELQPRNVEILKSKTEGASNFFGKLFTKKGNKGNDSKTDSNTAVSNVSNEELKKKFKKDLAIIGILVVMFSYAILDLLKNNSLKIPAIILLIVGAGIYGFLQYKKAYKTSAKELKDVEKKKSISVEEKKEKNKKISLCLIVLLLIVALHQVLGLTRLFVVASVVIILLGWIGIKSTKKKTDQSEKKREPQSVQPADPRLEESTKGTSPDPILKDEIEDSASHGESTQDNVFNQFNVEVVQSSLDEIANREVEIASEMDLKLANLMLKKSFKESDKVFISMEQKKGGRTINKIEVNKQHFLVGRNEKRVDYVDQEKGVSRIHFEMFSIEESSFIRDLNSKYGTSLNGVKLQPYKIYEVKENDKIQLKNSNYWIKNTG